MHQRGIYCLDSYLDFFYRIVIYVTACMGDLGTMVKSALLPIGSSTRPYFFSAFKKEAKILK
jgi:hypothetical protein